MATATKELGHDNEKMESSAEDLERIHFQRVIDAFLYYKSSSLKQVDRKVKCFKSIPQHHQVILQSQLEHFDRMKKAIETNHEFLAQVIEFTDNMFENSELSAQKADVLDQSPLSGEDMDKVRTTLKQLVRDWSCEGQRERDQCYKPIIDILDTLYPVESCDRSSISVLVPGAGLGRLMFDICRVGFACQGNEFSFYMLFTSNFVLNKCTDRECVSLHPWVHQTSNVFATNDQLREVRIPDVSPRLLDADSNFSMTAGDFLEVYQEPESWDCVCMCFFVDTAHNILAYVEKVYDILKPGGYWINFGPLLYHFADISCELSIEVSYEELRKVILTEFNFILVEERTGQKCSYVQNPLSMLKMEYDCVFFVVQKPPRL